MKITLDWNCTIAVENGEPSAAALKQLVTLHRAGKLNVALLAASASENTGSKRLPGTAHIFKQRVEAIGWSDLPLVPMPAICGLSYWDFCYCPSDSERFEEKFDALWAIMAPTVQRNPAAHLDAGEVLTDSSIQAPPLKKWRNTWCDVMSAYTHIRAGRDVFVTTNTDDFQKKSVRLAELGMHSIRTPAEALAAVLG